MKDFTDLDDHVRRCIMLLLPMPDLLRLSATSRGQRADLFRLMQGDLSARLSISLSNESPVVTGREASFRAFLQAGGAPLIKSLALHFLFSPQLRAHCLYRSLAPAMAWSPMPALESLAVSCEDHSGYTFAHRLTEIVADLFTATASQLRELRLSFPRVRVDVSPMLERISGAAASAGGSLTDVYIEAMECDRLDVIDGVGLLPCPPLRRLELNSSWVFIRDSRDASTLDHRSPVSSAAAREQSAGGPPFWQRIAVRPSRGVLVWCPGAVPLMRLLDSHPAEQLVIQGALTMRVCYVDRAVDDAKAEAEVMFRRRITS